MVLAEVLPDQKAGRFKRLEAEGRIAAMAGNTVNDVPALAQAQVGIAVGTGTGVAIESPGVTLVKGDLRGIARARWLSRATMRNIKQNLFFAFVYNALGVPIAAGVLYPFFGILLSPNIAAAAMSFSSVSVVGNALRLQRIGLRGLASIMERCERSGRARSRLTAVAQRGESFMSRTLTPAEARAFYDRFGAQQDRQRIYEDPAIEVLLARAAFEDAFSVVEVGCGTGRLAERLLRERLPAGARYDGYDVSSTMVNLTSERLAPWADRARVHLTDGSPALPLADRTCDRFLSAYVLDLLSEKDIRSVLQEARRLLIPGGRLCLATLTYGDVLVSRVVTLAWQGVHRLSPRLVGGCRPLRLQEFVGAGWRVLHREVVCRVGISTEVLVAS